VIPRPAQYLLRFDDLCPTMARQLWVRFLPLIEEFRLRPILAVIPDNQDPDLHLSPPDPEFWSRMRELEAAGATIALHGYSHLCVSQGKSLVPLHSRTEFAGVPEVTQRHWIHSGLAVLREQGLNPKIWVAPRHGFDQATLGALRKEGIRVLSDGFARAPFERDSMTWIPQQLWGPVGKSKGLWTICIHSNSSPDSRVDELRRFLLEHSRQFTSVDDVLAEMPAKPLEVAEWILGALMLLRIRVSRFRKKRRRHT